MTDSCQTCRFFYGRVDEWSGTAQCRRYPPQNSSNEHPRGGPVVIWLKVERNDWCGEHTPKGPLT